MAGDLPGLESPVPRSRPIDAAGGRLATWRMRAVDLYGRPMSSEALARDIDVIAEGLAAIDEALRQNRGVTIRVTPGAAKDAAPLQPDDDLVLRFPEKEARDLALIAAPLIGASAHLSEGKARLGLQMAAALLDAARRHVRGGAAPGANPPTFSEPLERAIRAFGDACFGAGEPANDGEGAQTPLEAADDAAAAERALRLAIAAEIGARR